jgi:hypothetical protein
MIVNNIYALPYVYKITNIITEEFYIGSRYQNVKLGLRPEKDIGVTYFTSGKLEKQFKQNPNNFIKEILFTDINVDIVYTSEQNYIKEHIKNPLCLNKQYTDSQGNILYRGKMDDNSKQRMIEKLTGRVGHKHTEEHKRKVGDLHRGKINSDQTKSKISKKNKGFSSVKDIFGNILRVSKDDPRIKLGELVGVAKGTTLVQDHLGNTFRVDNSDPRLLSGELVGANKGKKMPHKVKRKTVTCPHCLRSGDVSGMSRYHFDRCKSKPDL